MTDDRLLLGFPECAHAARRVAERAGIPFACVTLHRFPDGESLVRVPSPLPARVALYRSMDRPNDKLVELMFCASACREQGVESLDLVAPYLCYMRQDSAFTPGEAVSQRIVGGWLGGLFDRVVTVDPHLHRVSELEQVLPGVRTTTLSAATPIARYLASLPQSLVLLGPDEESAQWVAPIAEQAGLPWAVAVKRRAGDRDVAVELPSGFDCRGARVVLVDDVSSTGHTLAAAARGVAGRGALRVSCIVTHPVFCDEAMALLSRCGIADVWSTDTIEHPSNAVNLADVIAAAL